VDVPAGSPKVALFPRNGGFLFPERWLRQNGSLAFFGRTMQLGMTRARSNIGLINLTYNIVRSVYLQGT
jgi:hypothetical protein